MVLTDHYALLQADPGGGEKRDLRDTKGMKLWVAGSARAATVPEEKEPRWTAFEKVHISLIPVEVLAGQRVPQAATGSSRPQVATPAVPQPSLKADTAATNAPESVNDLRLQMRELTNANLDLRSQLKEQSSTIEKLKAELEGLRNEKKPGPRSLHQDRSPLVSRLHPNSFTTLVLIPNAARRHRSAQVLSSQ